MDQPHYGTYATAYGLRYWPTCVMVTYTHMAIAYRPLAYTYWHISWLMPTCPVAYGYLYRPMAHYVCSWPKHRHVRPLHGLY